MKRSVLILSLYKRENLKQSLYINYVNITIML